jgi:hypothetical protein
MLKGSAWKALQKYIASEGWIMDKMIPEGDTTILDFWDPTCWDKQSIEELERALLKNLGEVQQNYVSTATYSDFTKFIRPVTLLPIFGDLPVLKKLFTSKASVYNFDLLMDLDSQSPQWNQDEEMTRLFIKQIELNPIILEDPRMVGRLISRTPSELTRTLLAKFLIYNGSTVSILVEKRNKRQFESVTIDIPDIDRIITSGFLFEPENQDQIFNYFAMIERLEIIKDAANERILEVLVEMDRRGVQTPKIISEYYPKLVRLVKKQKTGPSAKMRCEQSLMASE